MYPCPNCGRPADLEVGCPYCGRPAPPLAVEVERLNRDIAEMSARDLAIQRERSNLSSRLQAAMHQRALLAAAQSQLVRRPPRQRAAPTKRATALLPPPARRRPPPAEPPPPPVPETDAADAGRDEPDGLRPEASSRSVQNLLLALGGLLVGVAALTFTVAALASLDAVARAAILFVACAAILMVPPFVVRRGLTATAETITTVGLVFVPLAGHALWQTGAFEVLPPTAYAGLVAVGTALIAGGYLRATGLTAPRYVALLAVQPAVPLLAYDWVEGPAGWALVFTGIAAADAAIGHALGHPALPSLGWLREVTWIVHGVAAGAGLVYAGVALATADTVPAALRASATILLAAGVGLAGALSLRRWPIPDVAAGIMTLAVIASAARVATVALPGRALVLVAGAVALTSVFVRVLPAAGRRGPQLATSGALAIIGTVVAAAAVRATAAPIRAVLPAWHADLNGYAGRLSAAVGTEGWQVAVSAALLTVAAALALPAAYRRESTVAGAAVSALATPAAFALGWSVTPWVLLAAAVVLGATGLVAGTDRLARVHVGTAFAVGSAAAATSLAEPGLTAAVLAGLTVAGVLLGFGPRPGPFADITAEAAQGGAAAALPGAVATAVAAAGGGTVSVLAATFLAVSVSLAYASIAQVATSRPNQPVAIGGTVGALAVAVAAFRADGATVIDTLVALLLLAGALLLWLTPSIDAGRRADRWVDGADIAAAAVIAGTIASLARVASILVPGTGLAATAALVLLVAVGVSMMPSHWRPGPILGCGLAGGVVLGIAGYAAVAGGARVLIAANPVWHADLVAWPSTVAGARGFGGQTPVALLLLAAAAAVVMPLRARAILVPTCVGLAVVGAPAALGMPWSAAAMLALVGATILGLAAAGTAEPHAGVARAGTAGVLAAFAVGASLVSPWATASALAGVAVAGLLVAIAARVSLATRRPAAVDDAGGYASPNHLVPVGGAAVGAALLALPGALAAAAASADRPADVVLSGALGATALGLALVALLRRFTGDYLTYATVATALSATGVAVAALLAGEPYGVYAAAAALLGVLTELLRRSYNGRPRWGGAGVLTPGLLATAAVPTLLALASIAPALAAVLVEPNQTLSHIWEGPDAAGVDWTGAADGPAVIAALVLTLAAGLAAAGFGERVAGSWRAGAAGSARLSRDEVFAQVVPVVIPGIAVTLLIAPAALGMGWPAGTRAAQVVFTIAMLGVALSPPPPDTEATRPLRITRWLVLAIGLAAGGAGLAGALATSSATIGTIAGAVGVGLVAALRGRTTAARVLGWAFAAASAHALAYTTGLAIGLPAHWSAFGVMTVAALCLVTAATLPRLSRPEARGEAPALEWTGYAGALLSLVLAARSLPHLAALLAAWGAVLGIAGIRPNRSTGQRRALLWTAVGFELAAWWLLLFIAEVALFEAYTLAFAAMALLVGVIELRHHPELGSWAAYGPALVAAFAPTLAIVLVTDAGPVRRIVLALAAAGTLVAGSIRRQRAPVVVGSTVTTIAALHALIEVSNWLIFIPIGILLVVLGANYEKRRRDLQRLRSTLRGMR